MKKKLTYKEIVKILDLSEPQVFIVQTLLKDSIFTQKEWEEELKRRNII